MKYDALVKAVELKAQLDATIDRYSPAYRLRAPGNWRAFADGSIYTDVGTGKISELGKIHSSDNYYEQEIKAGTAELMASAPQLIAELRAARKATAELISLLKQA